jgi:hypothetical protein
MQSSSSQATPSWAVAFMLSAYLGILWISLLLDTGWNGLIYFILAPAYLLAIVAVFVTMYLWRKTPLAFGFVPFCVLAVVGVLTVLTTYRGCGDSDRCEAMLPLVFSDPSSSMIGVYVHGLLPIVAVGACLALLRRTVMGKK